MKPTSDQEAIALECAHKVYKSEYRADPSDWIADIKSLISDAIARAVEQERAISDNLGITLYAVESKLQAQNEDIKILNDKINLRNKMLKAQREDTATCPNCGWPGTKEPAIKAARKI